MAELTNWPLTETQGEILESSCRVISNPPAFEGKIMSETCNEPNCSNIGDDTSYLIFHYYPLGVLMTVEDSDPERCVLRIKEAFRELRRLCDRMLQGTKHIYEYDRQYNEYELTVADDLARGSNVMVIRYPIVFDMSGETEYLARKRMESFLRWINAVSSKNYPNLADVRFLLHEVLDRTRNEMVVNSDLADILFPSASYWGSESSDEGVDDSAAMEAFGSNIWEALSLRTDSLTDAVSSLEFVSRIALQTKFSLADWKWVFISLHSALQGFMVNAIVGTSYQNVLDSDGRFFLISLRFMRK